MVTAGCEGFAPAPRDVHAENTARCAFEPCRDGRATATAVDDITRARTRTRDSPAFSGSCRWRAARLGSGRGPTLERVRVARSHDQRPLQHRPGPFRDRPRARRVAAGRRRAPTLRGAGIPQLPAVRVSGRRVCALSVRRVRPGSTRRVLVQGPRVLSAVRRAADGRAIGASAGKRFSGCARAPVGAEPAASRAVPAGVGPRSVPRRGRRDDARRAGLVGSPRAAGWRPGRPRRRRRDRATVRRRAQSQRAPPRARAGRRLRARRVGGAALPPGPAPHGSG